MRYETVIGLEVHAQLKTKSKLFCSCSTSFASAPNENTCPGCAAMPGTLPVLNAKTVELAVKMGTALHCTLNDDSVFSRKSYFYPDLPAGFQNSQFTPPICGSGFLDINLNGNTKKIRINRIHIEDDAGKSVHQPSENQSLVDLNRGGMALIEIVSEPDMRSAEEAVAYLKTLRAILLYLDVCDCNMEEGSLRCDANVSLRLKGEEKLGVRAELKNINSFRNLQRAIEYEVSRQQDVLEDGGTMVQQTRLYDSVKNITLAMRDKEQANDYRYFPNPDLLPVRLDYKKVEQWRAEMPELPAARLERFEKEYGLSNQDADILTSERTWADFFEDATKLCKQAKKVANLMMSQLLRELNQSNQELKDAKIKPEHLAEMIQLQDQGLISAKIINDIFPHIFASGEAVEAYVKAHGLIQISDSSALEADVLELLNASPNEVAAFKAGKEKMLTFFVGRIMAKTKGKANPAMVNELLLRHLQ